MDTFDLLIAAVLAIPVLAVISLIVAMSTRKRLKQLELRIAGLEWKLAALADQAPPAAPVTAIIPEPAKEEKTFATAAEPPPPSEPEEAAAPSAPPPPAPRRIGLEERFGTQWVVWAGGIALALGGFFLVRYSIEQGWFGPGARVVLAGIVALALIAAGEWARRREISTGAMGLFQGRHPERAHRRRHGGRLCRRLRGLRAVRLYRSGRRLRAARHRRPRHARRVSRAWTGAGGSRPGRRLPHAADRLDRATELLGALSLSRRGHGRVVRPRPGAALALARRHRRCRKRALGAARHRRSSGAWPARLPHRRRLHARGPADRLGPLVRAGCRAGRDRPGLIRRARRLSVRRDGARARHRPGHARAHAVRGTRHRDDGNSMAERRRHRRRSGRRHPRHA